MTTLFTSLSRRFSLLAFAVLLVAIKNSPVRAASTTTISKTAAVPLLKPQQKPISQYAFSDLHKLNDASDEIEEELVEEKSQTPMLKAVYQWYMKCCIARPFLAKGLTSATIAALGDVIAQNIEASVSNTFSPKRVATFFFCNLLFTGPCIHLWYTFLNVVGNWMDKRFDASKLKKTVTQVFLDQTLGTFVFFPLYIFVYDAFESVIRWHRRPSWIRATEKCQKHLLAIILTQYKVFPISNMINFGLVPYEMRVLFTSTVSLFWNIYLCSVVG